MAGARRARALVATVVAVGTFVVARAGDAGAVTDPCKLVTNAELRRAFDVRFEVMGTDETACFRASKPGQPLASIFRAAERFPADAIAAWKRDEQQAHGATTIRGVGDLTVYQTMAGEGGTRTVNLIVFEGNVVGRVA